MEKEIKPSVYIAMPCYDSVKINTMLSVIKLVEQFRLSGVKMGINTMKSPLIHQARNYLTSVFLTTEYQYLLFIDSDVEFEPDAVFRMLVAKKDIICTPYRVKSEQLDKHIYTVEFKDPKNIPFLPGGLVELEAGPTGLHLLNDHQKPPELVAGTMMAIAQRIYKTQLNEEEYQQMMDVVRDAPVKPYNIKKERLN
jgi:hypothetical protein